MVLVSVDLFSPEALRVCLKGKWASRMFRLGFLYISAVLSLCNDVSVFRRVMLSDS